MTRLQQERVQSVVGVVPDSGTNPGETVRTATGESYPTTSRWQAFHEPLRNTLLRNGAIAIIVGAVIARFWGGLPRWPFLTLLVLWPSLGGHWVEVWFLNWLRPRISAARRVQVAARFVVWFVGGFGLALGVALTAITLAGYRLVRWPTWWLAGLAFISVELLAHLALQLRGRPSFFNGRG